MCEFKNKKVSIRSSSRLCGGGAGRRQSLTQSLTRSLARSFGRSEDGNVAILSTMLLLPILVLMGGGLDVVRATTASSQLRSALDGAALASASLTSAGNVEDIINDYMAANLIDDSVFATPPTVTFSSNSALNSKTVTISASASVDTFFLKLVGIDTLPVTAATTANQSATNVELSLVLDVSSSMRGAKITNLKTAAKSFIDQILNEQNITRTSMNIVPFGGTVNIGSMFDDYAVPTTASSTTVDPTEAQYDIEEAVLNGAFRFSVGGNCIEYRYTDFNSDGVFPADSRGQVPHFWRWNNFNPWCPEDASSMLLNTNDTTALKNKIDALTLSDGTGMDIGAMWGFKVLSPAWSGLLGGASIFSTRPDAYKDDTQKVLVIMTDGAITQQDRPRDWVRLNTHTNRPTNNDTSQQQGNQGNNNNKQVILDKGKTNSSASANNAVGQFKRICDEAKAATREIVVYTIGFQISPGSLPESMLKYCASDPSKYYLVESLDIQSAFDSIAASVNSLRITG